MRRGLGTHYTRRLKHMGTSWNKRHAETITGVNGDAIDRSGMQKAYWRRYAEWKANNWPKDNKRKR